MAVFMVNICKFNGCGITFPRLPELIEHIEDVHIDYDPAVVEQKEASQPSCVPLSYVLKFITEASRRQIQSLPPAPMPEVRRRVISAPKAPSIRSNTPTGSEMDEDELMSPSEDSNDSWTTVEEYSSDYILRKANAQSSSAALPPAVKDKPFACPVPGCKKRYKNVNGIKYHSKNGHKKDGKVKKAYKCQCGKSYTTAQGLKSHSISQHIANIVTSQSFPEAPRSNVPKLPGVVVTASPANRQHVDGIDTSKLVRIYDSLKTKDLPTFTIPKHSLTSLNIVSANQNGQSRLSGLLTPNSTPGSSPSDKVKFDRSPRVTVQSAQSFAYGHEMSK